MSAVDHPLTLEQGASFDQSVTLIKDDATPFDLTGYTGKAQMRSCVSSAVKYDFVVSFNIPATDGIVKFSMSAEATGLIHTNGSSTAERRPTEYLYDIELTSPDDKVLRILEGVITVSPEITK